MECSPALYKDMFWKKFRILEGIGWSTWSGRSEGKKIGETVSLDRATPISEAGYVVFDTELTGLDCKNNSIVSIGAVKMKGGRIAVGDVFYKLVEPRTELTGTSVVIHGITPSEASRAQGIESVLPEFLEFCGNRIIVGHFVSIDLGFVNAEMKRLYGRSVQNHAVDTSRLFTWMRKNDGSFCSYSGGVTDDLSLASMATRYRIPMDNAHNALGDAFVTAQLFQRFLSSLPGLGIGSLRDLLKIGKP